VADSQDETILRERLLAERDERRRLAELIHDGPVQHIAALTQMLDAALHAVRAGETEPASTIVARSLEVAREAATELRAIVTDIEPAALAEMGFAAAVTEFAQRLSERRGIVCAVDVPAADQLGESASSGLYQIVRESLDQAVRRGPPGRIEISLVAAAAGGVMLTVTDDGGVERRQAVLDGLAERAAELNGSFHAARSGGLTTTRILLPPSATEL
jgi:two-component system, NarL family, sensor kinase